jgi:hypothetical protein
MTIRYQILCVSKKSVGGIQTITHIGGKNPLGQLWSLGVEEAIEGIHSGKWDFFINHERNTYGIQINESEGGLKTITFGSGTNLLLDLPECPK